MTPEPAPEQQPAAPAAAAPAVDLEKTIAELREQVAESQRTAQFWAERAQTPAAPAQAPAAPEPEEEIDVLEAITTEGATGFDRLAEKRGFIKRTEVEQLIDSRATAIQTAHAQEQQLLDQYPELKNRQSDFFKATASHYGALVKSGTPATTAMGIAANMAELEFMRSGKLKTPDGGGAGSREADRLARIAAQGGSAGPRRPSGAETDDDSLTAEQKHIAQMMGITEEAYLKRAKAGVQMGGRTK